jgi:3-hexulose-6-phosphate synthase
MGSKLQIAIDLATAAEAMDIVEKIHDIIDIVEVGTPMIIREGMLGVKMLKAKYPELTVLADTKIVDGGDLECADACEAGADIVTVLALSDNETVRAVSETAHKYGRLAMADLISVDDIPRRALELKALDIDLICVHTAVDVQKLGKTPLGDLRELNSAVPAEITAVAGGVKLSTIREYAAEHPAVIIAGGALYNAADIRQTAMDMKAEIEKEARA